MALIGDDCHFFLNKSCAKGPTCGYRHVEEAKGSEVMCPDWMHGICSKISCPLRHSEVQMNRGSTPCYYEKQPGGCTRSDCPFAHQYPKPVVTSAAPGYGMPPSVSAPQAVSSGWAPPVRAPPSSGHVWVPPQGPPLTRPRFAPPPGPGGPPQPFQPFMPPPSDPGYTVDQTGDRMMPYVEPVIINLNSEESDQESVKGQSPQKPLSRTIMPPVKSDNPLDYFLNAKPWIDPIRRRTPSPQSSPPYRGRSRSPGSPRSPHSPRSPGYRLSPARSISPGGRRRSISPGGRWRSISPGGRRRSISPGSRRRSISPGGRRRSISPGGRRRSISPVGRRRSVSMDRQFGRQRSHSLDRSRSQSPEARDRRRFGRRSRSPDRRDARSPGPPRGRPRTEDLRSRLKPQVVPVPRFAEVKVTGPKIISIKKDKKEEDKETTDVTEAAANTDKTKNKEEVDPKGFVEDEVKSLEEIYRERALKSLMDAKRKRIMEQKKKRWESVKTEKKSESESSVKSDTEKTEVEHEDKSETKDEDEEEEGGKKDETESEAEDSEADLADDVDVEIDAGEISEEEEDDKESKASEVTSEEEPQEKEEVKKEKKKKRTSAVTKVQSSNKPSIKSRLGLKAVEQISKQSLKDRVGANSNRARSIKERLGLKMSDDTTDRPSRTGVIKLSRSANDLTSRIRDRHGRHESRSKDKQLLLLPQITIRNNVGVEKRRAGIKQRLGLAVDDDSDTDSRRGSRKRRDLDEELLKLLEDEDMDIEESDLKLLTKKEKKKLYKKLLIQQGREDEYDLLRKHKKKSRRRERDYDEYSGRRKINMPDRLRPSPSPDRDQHESEEEEEVDDHLESAEEVELGEEEPELEDETPSQSQEEKSDTRIASTDVKENLPSPENGSTESIKLSIEERRQKALRLREALEPKSLDDIRRERAEKRARGETESFRVGSGKRKIMIADDPEEEPTRSEPPVRVTFKDEEVGLSRARESVASRIWSKRDKLDKGAGKRERQIYIPPSKKTDGPIIVNKSTADAVKKALQPPPGRDIVDYSEMYTKKTSISLDRLAPPKSVTLTTSASTEHTAIKKAPIKLQRGPPKVEVKDAVVKTFAEIMAEKKRKRLEAQQKNQQDRKPFKPIIFDEPEPSSQDSSSSVTADLRSRLSPFEDASSCDSTSIGLKQHSAPVSPVKPITKTEPITLNVPKKSTNANTTTAKLGRWKRRKTNPDIAATTTSVSKTEEVSDSVSQKVSPSVSVKTISETKPIVTSVIAQDVPKQTKESVTIEETPKIDSEPVPAKKPKLSDSFLDLDDDFLNMDDEDLDLNVDANQDHDELMKEIDELLA